MENTISELSFDQNWRHRPESIYSHWTRGEIENQIQLAFRQHWILIKEILNKPLKNLNVLEAGSGRGTMSCYFSDAGAKTTLLDNSQTVLDKAKNFFSNSNLEAEFLFASVEDIPLSSDMFDFVFSMGLLEHFEDPSQCIFEQLRVLKKGGVFFAYVIPENKQNVQNQYQWVNQILKIYHKENTQNSRLQEMEKNPVYRSSYNSDYYKRILSNCLVGPFNVCGVYPIPMISHSIDFPFSLMPKEAELSIVENFQNYLENRKIASGRNSWICDESFGQGFYLWCEKK